MNKLNQKGIAHLFILVVLALGLFAVLYLVSNRTNWLPKASVSGPVGPTTMFQLSPNTSVLKVGDTVAVKLNTRADVSPVNLLKAKISYNKDLLSLDRIEYTNSIVKNWVEQFSDNATGTISLVGGIPNPGFQTKLDVATFPMALIYFKAIKPGTAKLFITDESAIYTNVDNINILVGKDSIAFDITETGITPSPSASVAPSPRPVPSGDYLVKPYLVYPADKSVYPEYEEAVKNYMIELQEWYKSKVGITFNMAPLQIVKSKYSYNTMRCDPSPFDQTPPSAACLNDSKRMDGNWGVYMNLAIHNGVEKWDEKTATLVFSAGGGGYAGADKYPNNAGWAITGDWVLEPISGKANDWGIPCKYSDGWQCAGGVPKGSPAHELGHAFGLPHPDEKLYPGNGVSIMRWHGDYPTVGFLPHEITYLKTTPFFTNFTQSSPLPTPTLSPIPSTTPTPGTGDGNKDGKVDLIDLSVLLTDYNKNQGFRISIDMNGDGTINAFDFGLLRNLLIQKGVIKG